jgi:phosphatidylinositol-3-phosphatase
MPRCSCPGRTARSGRVRRLCTGLACCLVAAGCGAARPARGGTAPPAPASRAPQATTSAAGQPGPGHKISKIIVIMEENHSNAVVFPSGMPYLWQLARRYGQATAWSSIGHPSLPNYLAIFGGSAFGDPQDCLPGPGCTYPGPTVFGQAIARGETARAYEESMPRPCDPADGGNYDVNHNPWAYFPDEARLCRADDIPAGTPSAGALASDVRRGTLPTVGLITPNLISDAHNGTLAGADAWLRSWIPVLMSGPDWRDGRLAVVVVFDEGDTTQLVPFVIMAPGVSGVVVRRPVDQYALTRLIDEVAGTPPLRQASRAPDIAPLFGVAP